MKSLIVVRRQELGEEQFSVDSNNTVHIFEEAAQHVLLSDVKAYNQILLFFEGMTKKS